MVLLANFILFFIGASLRVFTGKLDRFEKTSEMLINFNRQSNVRLQQMNERFLLHTRTLVEMKKDLDSVFRRIWTQKGKIAKQYSEAFSSEMMMSLTLFPQVLPQLTATSEQSTESCDTSPDVISPTVSRCSEDLSQEPPDTPAFDVLETAVLLDEELWGWDLQNKVSCNKI
uniref:KxDL motif-containing protein 1 n=1 Tax=Amphiprion ocellaris TaxID=80972 RepID=A0A3Q1CI86_AMPOC